MSFSGPLRLLVLCEDARGHALCLPGLDSSIMLSKAVVDHASCRVPQESERIQASAQSKEEMLRMLKELVEYETREAADLQVGGVNV